MLRAELFFVSMLRNQGHHKKQVGEIFHLKHEKTLKIFKFENRLPFALQLKFKNESTFFTGSHYFTSCPQISLIS